MAAVDKAEHAVAVENEAVSAAAVAADRISDRTEPAVAPCAGAGLRPGVPTGLVPTRR